MNEIAELIRKMIKEELAKVLKSPNTPPSTKVDDRRGRRMKLRVRYTPEEDQRLLDLRSKGVPFKVIARRMGRKATTLAQRHYTLRRKSS